MQKAKTVCKILMLLIMVCFLTGCWDRKELEGNAYVIGLGIDHSKQKGKITVTMLIANPEVGSMQGGGGSTEKPREIISFDANDIIAAKATANAVISRDINYELLKIIVVSEKYAKNPNFTRTITDVLKDKEIRLSTFLAVSKENASDYFKQNRPKMETRPHKYFQYMVDHGIENGLIPDSTLFRYFKTMNRGTDLFLAMYTTAQPVKKPKIKGEDEYMAGQLNVKGELDDTQFLGSAVFKNGVMIDKLNGQDTRTVNILDDTTDIKDILIDIPNPFQKSQKQYAVRVMKTEKNKVKMNLKGARPKIYITLPLQFQIMSNPSMVNFADDKNKQLIKKQIAKHMKTVNDELFKKTQSQLRGVPFPLSMYSLKYFGTIQEYKKFNWGKSYLRADIIVKPDISIVDYGKQTKQPAKVGG